MRKTQYLLVEFSEFAEKIESLLEFIRNSTHSDNDEGKRFLCHMTVGDQSEATVDILEYNHFRHLLHLKLQLREATDKEAKAYLARKLLVHRQVNGELQRECSQK